MVLQLGTRNAALTGSMDPIGTNPASFVIRGDDGQEVVIPVAATNAAAPAAWALMAGAAAPHLATHAFPAGAYEEFPSLLGAHGFGGPSWWEGAGHPVQRAIWAAACDGHDADRVESISADTVSLEDITESARTALTTAVLTADQLGGARPARVVVWFRVPLLDVVSAASLSHAAELHGDDGYLPDFIRTRTLKPGEDHIMDRESMGRSCLGDEGVAGLMHFVLQANFGPYALDVLLVVDSAAGVEVTWPASDRHLDAELLHELLRTPKAIVALLDEDQVFRVTVQLVMDGQQRDSWAEAGASVRSGLSAIVQSNLHDTVRVSVYLSRFEQPAPAAGALVMGTPMAIAAHHDSARRVVETRAMLAFDIDPDIDLAQVFANLEHDHGARAAQRADEGLQPSRTLCIVPAADGSRHTENTAAISTPCADAEKARARYMVHMFVACLLSQRPAASTREICRYPGIKRKY